MPETIVYPEIVGMADRIYQKFVACRTRAKKPELIDLQMRLQWRLGNTEVSPELLASSIAPIYEIFEDKRALLGTAYQYVERLTHDRFETWSDEEKTLFAGYICSRPGFVYDFFVKKGHVDLNSRWPEGVELPDSQPHEAVEVLNTRLPNEPFLAYTSPIKLPSQWGSAMWNRGEGEYPQTNLKTPSQTIQKVIDKKAQAHILDVGCGDNYFLHCIKKKFGPKVITIGVKPENIHIPDRPMDEEYCGYAELLPVDWSDSVDVAYTNTAFTYFLYPKKALSEIVRVLRPGGTAHLDTYSNYSPSPNEYDFMRSILGISQDDYIQALTQNCRFFQSRQTIQDMVDEIAYTQNTDLQVKFDSYTHIYKRD